MFRGIFGRSDKSKKNIRNSRNKSTLENFPNSQSNNNSIINNSNNNNQGTRISAPNGGPNPFAGIKRKPNKTPVLKRKSVNDKNTITPVKQKRRIIPGKKEAGNVKEGNLKRVATGINKTRQLQNAQKKSNRRFRKENMINMDDLVALYNVYSLMLQRRSMVLSDRFKSNKTDNELNAEYVNLMKTQLGKTMYNKIGPLEKIMNFVFKFGGTVNDIMLRNAAQRKQVFNIIENKYKLRPGSTSSTLITNFKTLNSYASKKGSSIKISTAKNTPGFRRLNATRNINVLQNNNGIKNLLYGGELLPKLMTLFRMFEETNDLYSRLTNILKESNNSFRKKELIRLFNLDPSKNIKAIDVLNLLRSRSNAKPMQMLPAPYPGPKHHVMSVGSLKKLINTNVYVGIPSSLQSILFYTDAILLQRNNIKFNGPNGKNVRNKADRPILRQEPALLKPPEALFNHVMTINRCNTNFRHGGIHCGLVSVGYDKSKGEINRDKIKDNQIALDHMARAYESNKGNFSYKEMYTLLDTDNYQAISLKGGVPTSIKNDMDENVDEDHFFQSFIYIFGSPSSTNQGLRVDILKLISDFATKTGTSGIRVQKKNNGRHKRFVIQTNYENMKQLLTKLYKEPAHKVIGEIKLREVLETLNKSYKEGLSKDEINRIINDSKTGNITANRKKIWNNIGLKSPSN
jgi:hypothetical protein